MTDCWVTRRGVGIDRIASAWLIRRFIDPKARFRFVDSACTTSAPGEVRFDMFDEGCEFTHRGDLCTFEVLLGELDRPDAALRSIGEIIHDLDLKDRKFRRAETSGVASLIAAIVATHPDDPVRIERGCLALDALYASFSRTATAA